MMQRYVCIHAHFYQPPRENPWLEDIEVQDSAYPYHDWNERVTSECYAPNSASRLIDGEKRITDIVNNYSRISFNFGPTLLSWMEKFAPEVYRAVLEADRLSMQWRSGHGNAIAQVYNHIIMPLASRRDKITQVIWGIRDFEHRFRRPPEGMWLAETAVDLETLNILAEHGIKFTILAPRQAARTRKAGAGKWKDVGGGSIDPAMPYICRLPSRRKIAIFFYDGPISQAVAFEKLLNRGEDFANRLLTGFSDLRNWPQMLHIATDGETYGHHHRFGDMALAYALDYIESKGLAVLTNYGEYLEKHPPAYEVQIFENSSWSCVHGIERWRNDCGCNSGGHAGWTQQWRGPLRDSLNWLRDTLLTKYEIRSRQYLKNPWKARDEYIEVILDRSQETIEGYFARHAKKSLSDNDKITVLKLLEVQRHAMLMFTSCGWFFDELSGLETVQVIQYAGRAIQLSENIFQDNIENTFLQKLSSAKSNIREHENGAVIYKKFVKPAMIDLKKVAAHFAVSSIFEKYTDESSIFCYTVRKEDFRKVNAGKIQLAVGNITVSSRITRESERIGFGVLHLGDHAVNGGVRTYDGEERFRSMKDKIIKTFERGAFADIVRLIDKYFGMNTYSLMHLFRDQQRKILNLLISETLKDVRDTYSGIYENNRILMGFLKNEAGVTVPDEFSAAAKFALNYEIRRDFEGERIDVDGLMALTEELKRWNISIDATDIEFIARHKIESLFDALHENPKDLSLLLRIQNVLEMLKVFPVELNYWQVQNVYFNLAKTVCIEFLEKAAKGDKDAGKWVAAFKYIGEMLYFHIDL